MLNTIRGNDFKFTVASNISLRSLKSGKDIYYIGGTEVLPAPLEPHEEAVVINELTNNQSDSAKKMLIERNLRLVVYIAKKFDNTGVGIEDLISIGTIGLIKAINTFKNDKNIKLATYASRCIERRPGSPTPASAISIAPGAPLTIWSPPKAGRTRASTTVCSSAS